MVWVLLTKNFAGFSNEISESTLMSEKIPYETQKFPHEISHLDATSEI